MSAAKPAAAGLAGAGASSSDSDAGSESSSEPPPMSAAKPAAAGGALPFFLLFFGGGAGASSSEDSAGAMAPSVRSSSSSSLSSCLLPPLPPFFLSFLALRSCAFVGPADASSSSSAAVLAAGFAAGGGPSSSELTSPFRLPFLFLLGLPKSAPPPFAARGSTTSSSSLRSCRAFPFLPPFFPISRGVYRPRAEEQSAARVSALSQMRRPDGTSREISPRAAVAWRRASSPQGARGGASVVREHRPEATLPRARRSGRGRGRARGTAHFFEPALSAALAASELGARSRIPDPRCPIL